MTLDELRAACERAGMNVRPNPYGSWSVIGPIGHRLIPEIAENREWIEARCASLLVAKVRERVETSAAYREKMASAYGTLAILAGSKEQIGAAMAVLGEGT